MNICHLILIFLTTSITAITVEINCDTSPFRRQFIELFSLDLKLEGKSQIHFSPEKRPEVTPTATLKITDTNWSLSSNALTLRVTLDAQCSLVHQLECELYGYSADDQGYKNISFIPKVHFDGTVRKKTIKQQKDTYSPGDVSLVTCSADVGTNDTEWLWQVLQPGETEYNNVAPENIHVFPSLLRQCTYHTVTRLIYINSQSGTMRFRCLLRGTEVGNVSARILSNEEGLGTMLFSSTTIFVYTHFICLPFVFAKWDKVFTYRENDLMLKWRAFISYVIAFCFLICDVVVCSVYEDAAHLSSYLAFAIIEWLVICIYATLRLASNHIKRLSVERKGLLNNARVATSFAAVLVPILCWIIIKIQGGVGNIVLEVIYYLLTAAAILSFVCISFDREGKYWDDKLS